MSIYLDGVTFDEQLVTAGADARLNRAAYTDGIINGCVVSYSGDTLYVSPGNGISCGRMWRIPAELSVPMTSAEGYFRAKVVIDESATATQAVFEQVRFVVEYSNADAFGALTQDDINGAGTIYEWEMCRGRINGGAIVAIIAGPATAQTIAGTLRQGRELDVGENIDELTDPGVYRSINAERSQSLTGDVPYTSGGFRLVVMYTSSGSALRQEIITPGAASQHYVRNGTGEPGTWHPWVRDNIPSGVLDIEHGGTGATTSQEAREAIGAAGLDYTQNGMGTEIPQGANINTYTQAGVFYCPNADRAASLFNPPTTTAGFRLEVLYTSATTYVYHIAYINGGAMRLRYFNPMSGVWTEWLTYVTYGTEGLNYTENGVGKEIPQGSNLNNYLQAGVYFCPNAARAATITNTPTTTAGFRLEVLYTSATTYVYHIAYINGGAMMSRYFNPTTNTWTEWLTYVNFGASGSNYTENGMGKEIPKNTNLNTYTQAGVFFCPNADQAATLLNAPTTAAGFRLEVLYTSATTYVYHVAYINGGAMRLRYFNPAASTWTDWIEYAATSGATFDGTVSFRAGVTANNGLATASITGLESVNGTPIEEAYDVFGALPANYSPEGVGAAIAAQSDLDTYTTPGAYSVLSAAIAATIVNTPATDAGYRLVVTATSSTNYLAQIAYINSGVIKIRFFNGAAGTWGTWNEYAFADGRATNGPGATIAAGENLNAYTTAGNYRVISGAVAAEITNSPTTTAGFRLEVKALSSANFLVQIAYINGGLIRVRFYNGAWDAWKTVTLA